MYSRHRSGTTNWEQMAPGTVPGVLSNWLLTWLTRLRDEWLNSFALFPQVSEEDLHVRILVNWKWPIAAFYPRHNYDPESTLTPPPPRQSWKALSEHTITLTSLSLCLSEDPSSTLFEGKGGIGVNFARIAFPVPTLSTDANTGNRFKWEWHLSLFYDIPLHKPPLEASTSPILSIELAMVQIT